MTESPKKRIELIDSLRGLAVMLMVIHHLFYDLCWLMGDWVTATFGSRWILFSNPVFNVLHYIFAGTFVFLSGVSSRFSRSNLKRGLIALGIALVMTLVTSLPIVNSPILFGVLHLLGFSMVFYGLFGKLLDKLPRPLQPVIYIGLLLLTNWLVGNVSVPDEIARFIFPLGWTYRGFYSSDWFPIFPWLFVFLTGTWAGWYVKARRLPGWFYDWPGVPFVSWLGRHSLIIYIIHQPVLYGIVMAVSYIF